MLTTTQNAPRLFGFSFFWPWPSNQVAPAPLSTNNVALIVPLTPKKESTSSTASDSSDEPSPPAVRSPVTFTLPKMMPEIHKLRLIQDYAAYYLDHLTADSPEDEECYQHNKQIILNMVAHGKDVIKLPTTEGLSDYCDKIAEYDKAIRDERKKFNPQLKKLEKRTPSFAGKKSKILAYLYFDYLHSYAAKRASPNKNTQKIDRFRFNEITNAFETITTINIDFTDIDTAITQMRAAVKLRKQRHIELSRPAGTLEIEKTVALLSNEDKEKWMQKAVKVLQPLHRECQNELKAHPEKFPAQSKIDLYEAYFSDLVYSQAPDYHLFIKRCSKEDYAKIQAFAKMLDHQADIYAEKVSAFKRIGTTHPIDTQHDSNENESQYDSDNEENETQNTEHTTTTQSVDRADSLNSVPSVFFDDESRNESEGEYNAESDDESEREYSLGSDDENDDEEVRAAEENTHPSSLSLSQR